MRALVLDGDSRSSLAIVRSLGKHKISVSVAWSRAASLAGMSRYCSKRLVYPCPSLYPDEFIQWLQDILTSAPDTIVYTASDITTSLVGKYRNELLSPTINCLPSQQSLEIALDKSATIDLASQLNIPIPKSVEFNRSIPINLAKADLQYPVVVKVSESDLADRPPTIYASNPSQLEIILKSLFDVSQTVLVQELISGEGTSIFALFDRGEPIVTFAHRRKLEKPPWGGVSVLSEGIEEPRDTLNYAMRILRKLEWHGIAMVEFKRNINGVPCLMEINPRFWGSLEVAIRSGVDFPYLFYQLVSGAEMELPNHRRFAINRWLIGELDSLLITLKTRTRPDGLQRPRLAILLLHLIEMRRGLCCEVERISDPQPAFYEHYNWLRSSVRSILSPAIGGKTACKKSSILKA